MEKGKFDLNVNLLKITKGQLRDDKESLINMQWINNGVDQMWQKWTYRSNLHKMRPCSRNNVGDMIIDLCHIS